MDVSAVPLYDDEVLALQQLSQEVDSKLRNLELHPWIPPPSQPVPPAAKALRARLFEGQLPAFINPNHVDLAGMLEEQPQKAKSKPVVKFFILNRGRLLKLNKQTDSSASAEIELTPEVELRLLPKGFEVKNAKDHWILHAMHPEELPIWWGSVLMRHVLARCASTEPRLLPLLRQNIFLPWGQPKKKESKDDAKDHKSDGGGGGGGGGGEGKDDKEKDPRSPVGLTLNGAPLREDVLPLLGTIIRYAYQEIWLQTSSASLGVRHCESIVMAAAQNPLKSLTKLDLQHNPEIGQAEAAYGWVRCPSLRVVVLADCGLEDEGWVRLKRVLDESNKQAICPLEFLDVRSNRLTALGITALLSVVSSCTRLEHLNVAENKLRDDGVQEVLNFLSRAPSLLHLSLKTVQMTDVGAIAIADSLARTPRLQTLILSGNDISRAGARALSRMAQVNHKLKTLEYPTKCFVEARAPAPGGRGRAKQVPAPAVSQSEAGEHLALSALSAFRLLATYGTD